MNYLRFSIWSAGAVLAAFVAYASFVIVGQVRAPLPPVAPFLWHTGTSQANYAYASFGLRKNRDPKATINSRELQLASQAYGVEPLSSAAIGLIIAAMTNANEADTREKLIDLAGKLSRRSAVITSLSIEEAARANDQKRFFLWMSRAILTDTALRSKYVGAMSIATARDGAVSALLPVLGPDPSWAKYYWTAVASQRPSLANATALRIAIAGRPWGQSKIKESDYLLARRLVEAGQFDDAAKLASALGSVTSGNNLLTNGNFGREPLLPPMDWTLATSGQLGASVDVRSERLAISAIAGAFGRVAGQLIELTPGVYRFAWVMNSDKPISDRALSVKLSCAEAGLRSGAIQPVALVAGKHAQDLSVPSGACRWFWFSINAHVAEEEEGFDIFLRQISLTKVG